jgi:hypothetical protein|tara:strand:+ start:52 stop:681 length:630 start_codon:yes stop_codon:yes gene_type:complete
MRHHHKVLLKCGTARSTIVLAVCNKAHAKYDDGFLEGDGSGYKEFSPSEKKIRFVSDTNLLDYEKYPELGFECPWCAMTKHAYERHLEDLSRHKNLGEEMLRKILERTYGKEFPNVRPSWLLNPNTGCNLEIDCYCEELGLAFEYQGQQHYNPVSFFGGEASHEKVVERDRIKKKICEDRGIKLIAIDGRKFPHGKNKQLASYIAELSK